MKKLYALICFFLIISLHSVSYSQKLSAGFVTGINFSDIHGNSYSGKWKYKPGPLQGITLNYNFYKFFSLQTGLNFSTFYYEHKGYSSPQWLYVLPYSWSSSFVLVPDYYSSVEKMDFSFLTVPAQLRIAIPSKPQLSLSAGIFYSFLLDHYLSHYYNSEVAKNDFGYLYSAGLSYPLNDDIDISFNVRYMTGRKEFPESGTYRHGSYDFVFGMAYNGFLRNKTGNISGLQRDTINEKIYLVYKGGINVSWNSGGYFSEKYSLNYGPSLGFALNFRLSPKSFFQTGFSFERTGYSLKDSSDSFHRYVVNGEPNYYVDTRVSADYILIPALLNFQPGRSGRFFFNTGPYLAIKLNARCKGEAFSESGNQGSYNLVKRVVYDDLEGIIRDNDIGWLFGGGVTMPFLGKYLFDLGLQYRIGFKDVFDRSYFSEVSQVETGETIIRNGSLSFQISLRVPIFK